MLHKNTAQAFVAVLVLLAFLAVPSRIQAGGAVCGGTYVVQWGDTLSAIAERCKTSVNA
jgi:LysM repeat protein